MLLPLASDWAKEILAASQSIEAAKVAGWLTSDPAKEGFEKVSVGWVVLRYKQNDDESETPVVDLYSEDDRLKHAVGSVYLNTPKDRESFFAVSGIDLQRCKVYVGSGKLERGKSRQTDDLFAKSQKPFAVVFRANPKYDPAETDATKKKPKRLFVRWVPMSGGDNVVTQSPPGSSAPPPATSQKTQTEFARISEILVGIRLPQDRPRLRAIYSDIQDCSRQGRLSKEDLDILRAVCRRIEESAP